MDWKRDPPHDCPSCLAAEFLLFLSLCFLCMCIVKVILHNFSITRRLCKSCETTVWTQQYMRSVVSWCEVRCIAQGLIPSACNL